MGFDHCMLHESVVCASMLAEGVRDVLPTDGGGSFTAWSRAVALHISNAIKALLVQAAHRQGKEEGNSPATRHQHVQQGLNASSAQLSHHSCHICSLTWTGKLGMATQGVTLYPGSAGADSSAPRQDKPKRCQNGQKQCKAGS